VHEDGLDDSHIKDLDLDRRFFRIHYGNDVPALYRVSWFDQPLNQGAGFHVGTQ
jgi:hypothetical protein